ncbi:single-stranded DNA-binding protein [Arthrobacter pigmenti]
MSESITVRGFVASEVRRHDTHSGDELATFRMGSTERRFNRQQNTWEDGETNWYSVSCFRGLAKNVAVSLNKGEKVVVHGRLQIRPWTSSDGRAMTTVGIEALTVGHDLMWGISGYRRVTKDNPIPWIAVQTPDPESGTSDPWVDRETGEIQEGNEIAETEDAESGWEQGTNAVPGEDLPELSEETEDAVRAA